MHIRVTVSQVVDFPATMHGQARIMNKTIGKQGK